MKPSDGEGLPWQTTERTVTLVECRCLIGDDRERIPVSGRLRLTIAGHLDQLAIGDVIEVSGELLRPSEPGNPGEFNNRQWQRTQGLHAGLVAKIPESLNVLGRERGVLDWLAVFRSAARQRAENLIAVSLRPRTSAVAQSLLLGSRVELGRDLRRAFAESGTLHVLAISGMNVGLLWAWLWFVFRLMRFSRGVCLVAVLTLLPAYALITDINPPVVRATIVAEVMAFGLLLGRSASRWNSLAVAALAVLAWNPSDLFNAGAQLSFVAVWAILLTVGFWRSIPKLIQADGVDDSSWWWRSLRRVLRPFVESCAVGGGIWVMTSPLIASQFHLVSPAGFVLNVLLAYPIIVMFWLGYSFLLLGMISPTLFWWMGIPFDWSLEAFLFVVETSAKWNLSHNYVPTPPLWWLIGFYTIIFSLAVIDQWRGRLFWSVRGGLIWSVIGLAVCLRSGNTTELRCTVLSMGHGLSVLIECPNGRTVLYDAGGMTGGARAARTIENAIWASGKVRLDGIVVSHADVDHCNAVPELVQVVPTRSLLIHRTFLDWTQQPVAVAIENSAAAGVHIQLLAADQQIQLDPNVTIRVLHPPPEFASREDNANSIVLSVEYAGRRIVLTGDLEHLGLTRLMTSQQVDADVLLSPHHGSKAANTSDLARWATPEWVLVSCRDDSNRDRLAANYGSTAQVLTTARYGAIRCRIRQDGELLVEPFRQQPQSHHE